MATLRGRTPATALQFLAAAVLVLSPMAITTQLYKKPENLELQAGQWLAQQTHLKSARILTTDYRILFYAGRQVNFHEEGNDIHYRNTDDLYHGKMEEFGIQKDLDLLVIHPGADGMSSFVEGILYPLWDAGLDVQCVARTIEQNVAVAQADARSRTKRPA